MKRWIGKDFGIKLADIGTQQRRNQPHRQQATGKLFSSAPRPLQQAELLQRFDMGCRRNFALTDNHLAADKRAHLDRHALRSLAFGLTG